MLLVSNPLVVFTLRGQGGWNSTLQFMLNGTGGGVGTPGFGAPAYEAMTIRNTHVGINTSNPPYSLSVAPGGGGSGLGVGWNLSGGTGETDFYNYGQGGPGGFSFKNYSAPGASFPTTGSTNLMSISSVGDVTALGNMIAAKFCLPGSAPSGNCITTWPSAGGSGTVNPGSQYQLAFYAADGSAVSESPIITTNAFNDLVLSYNFVQANTKRLFANNSARNTRTMDVAAIF